MKLKRFMLGLLLCVLLSASICACGKTNSSAVTDMKEPAEKNKESPQIGAALKTTDNKITLESTNNDTDNKKNQLFKDFIEGKISATLDDTLTNELSLVCMKDYEKDGKTISMATFSDRSSINLDELTQHVAASPNLDTSGIKSFYACIDTNSEEKVLAVKYQGVGLDVAGDESCAYFIFVPENEKLKMVYCRDSSARRYCQLNDGVTFTGHSNQGAGDSEDWCGRIKDGAYKQLYSVETLNDDWVAMYDENADIDDTAWSRGCKLELIETEEGTFYCCKAADSTDRKKLESFFKMLEEKGMKKTEKDAAAFIKSALDAADIKKDAKMFENWEPLNTDKSLKEQSNAQTSADNICVFGPVKEVTKEGLLINNQSDVSSSGGYVNYSICGRYQTHGCIGRNAGFSVRYNCRQYNLCIYRRCNDNEPSS